tara:strand:+ start:7917 stop:8924 length:1008 start_codon:yes stop_codon:yes gene_type:complete
MTGHKQYDLSSSEFDPIVYKEDILKVISEYQLLKQYFPELELDTANKSPFRDDSVPSFGVTMRSGFLYWRDFATGESGNIWSLVARKEYTDFSGALQIIARDLGIKDGANFKKIAATIPKVPIPEKKQVNIGIRSRKWQNLDKKFWSEFGITKSTLERYLVSPIDFMFFNGHPRKADHHSYVYRELKDKVLTFKIYQPFSKEQKWISNNNQSVWEGWSQLPETGDLLIITSSRKDTMSIVDVVGLPAVALQGESMTPKQHVVQQLKDRFKKVYVLYDNDFNNPNNPGRILGKKIASEFNLTQIEIPSEHCCKDFSDLVKKHGKNNANKILQKLLI